MIFIFLIPESNEQSDAAPHASPLRPGHLAGALHRGQTQPVGVAQQPGGLRRGRPTARLHRRRLAARVHAAPAKVGRPAAVVGVGVWILCVFIYGLPWSAVSFKLFDCS